MPDIDPMLNAADNRQPPDPPDIVERLRTAASNNRHQAEAKRDTSGHVLDHAQVVGKRAVAEMHDEAADEIERMQRLLDGRDDFIVSKGLWLDFTGQLEP